MSDVEYRTIQGFVFGGPWERNAAGKDVRDYSVSAFTPGQEDEIVRVTLWPSHEEVVVNIGDYIIVNGRWEAGMFAGKDGEKRMRRNVSANKVINAGNGLGDNVAEKVATPVQARKPKTEIDF